MEGLRECLATITLESVIRPGAETPVTQGVWAPVGFGMWRIRRHTMSMLAAKETKVGSGCGVWFTPVPPCGDLRTAWRFPTGSGPPLAPAVGAGETTRSMVERSLLLAVSANTRPYLLQVGILERLREERETHDR